jgi:hypothetical protein
MAASSDNLFMDDTNPDVIAAMWQAWLSMLPIQSSLKEAVASLAGNGVEPERIVNFSMTFSPATAAANRRALKSSSPGERSLLAANNGILTMSYAIEVPSSVSHRISEAMSNSTEAMAQQVISSKISEVGWIVANESPNATITLDVKSISQPVVVQTSNSTHSYEAPTITEKPGSPRPSPTSSTLASSSIIILICIVASCCFVGVLLALCRRHRRSTQTKAAQPAVFNTVVCVEHDSRSEESLPGMERLPSDGNESDFCYSV